MPLRVLRFVSERFFKKMRLKKKLKNAQKAFKHFLSFNIVSSNPPLISLSVQRSKGERKDTARNIIQTGEFVVHIVDEDHVKK